MTHVARLFEEEKLEAVNTAVSEAVNTTTNDVRTQIARNMLAMGDDILKVMQVTNLTRLEVDQLQVPAGV